EALLVVHLRSPCLRLRLASQKRIGWPPCGRRDCLAPLGGIFHLRSPRLRLRLANHWAATGSGTVRVCSEVRPWMALVTVISTARGRAFSLSPSQVSSHAP